jgi:hypothetical protein
MHSDLSTTDKTYAILSSDEVRKRLESLQGETKGELNQNQEIII